MASANRRCIGILREVKNKVAYRVARLRTAPMARLPLASGVRLTGARRTRALAVGASVPHHARRGRQARAQRRAGAGAAFGPSDLHRPGVHPGAARGVRRVACGDAGEGRFVTVALPARAMLTAMRLRRPQAGAIITDDISAANTIFCVKEFPAKHLLPNKTYVLFSHTIKAQPENMPFLDACLERNVRLIDYECIKEVCSRHPASADAHRIPRALARHARPRRRGLRVAPPRTFPRAAAPCAERAGH
jgi:hypothetical protein